MTLAIGMRLGPYEIIALLGAGGMGEVYRARDTKLNRDVALKILPDAFAADPDRLARFTREAQTLAALNHPHIAHIHGLEESTSVRALVMELVEGEDLAQRIARGPIPLDEALPIAHQIAEALEAAHEQGIIHRDLKPANIKVRADGTVKVLDFGLAKALDPLSSSPAAAALANSPTMTSPAATFAGVILGTAAYMSPEQARGKPVDKRTDIWGFGCVLFEMLTGRKPFDGETLTDTVAAVVKNEPDWQALPPGTPAAVQSVIARCLKKDPAQRLHDIADGRFQLEDLLHGHADVAGAPVRHYREWAAWIVAGLFLGVALFLTTRPSTPTSSANPISFPVFPPEGSAFSAAINTTVNVPSFALAPDGQALVFAAQAPGGKPMLWLRSMDRVGARELSGTEDAQDPFWSPDGRWIGFFAEGRVKKIPAAGGPVQVVTETGADSRGGTWGSDDTILFSTGSEILRVNAAGGKTSPVTIRDASHNYRNPHFLPDGNHFLFHLAAGTAEESGVWVGSLDAQARKILIHVAAGAVYVPPGYLMFVDGDTLVAQGFDADRLDLKGQPFVVAQHVGRNSAFMSAVSASRAGTIAYAGALFQNGRLTWMDRGGNPLGSAGIPEGDYTDFRLSPDEKRLATSLVDPKTGSIEIWLADLVRNNTSRFAFGVTINASVLWSPDGGTLAYRAFHHGGLIEFVQRSAAGGGNDQTVLPVEVYRAAQILTNNLIPTDWSPDRRHIIFSAPSPASGNDLWLVPLVDGGKPEKFIASAAEEMHGNFSSNSHLVAYTSNESGRFEVYVETVPRSDRKWSVSTNGGYEPRWRADGREIYYLSDDRKLMAVPVGAGPTFGIPQPLFQTRVPAGVTANRTHFVPSRDGQRFLVNQALDASASPITVALNWTAMLKR
jgi:serine/threonine protein kinase/Tol biopolymer transport system component